MDNKLVSECDGDKQCIYDSLATGSRSTGLNTKILFRRYQKMNTTLSKWHEAEGGVGGVS